MTEFHAVPSQRSFLTTAFISAFAKPTFAPSMKDQCGDSLRVSLALTDCSDNESTSNSLESTLSACPLYPAISRVAGLAVYDVSSPGNMYAFIEQHVRSGVESGSFLVCNLGSVVTQFEQWTRELPNVEPFYAVKCNPDPAIIRVLANLGCGFDCATMGEIDLVLHGLGEDLSFANERGKAGEAIVYANPAKMEHMLQFAMDHDVRMTVFDGEDELHKIAKMGGQGKLDLLLRLTTDDKSSLCQFSKKFGCPVADAPKLLDLARQLGLHVAGVSFHVGSSCGDPGAYITALKDAQFCFSYAVKMGMRPMTIVDMGGGFPGGKGGTAIEPGLPSFQTIAAAIRAGIAMFNKDMTYPVRFIAEPGRYFVFASTAVATRIYARKGGDSAIQALYCDDGVYGSFNNVIYDHVHLAPRRISFSGNSDNPEDPQLPSAVFGPTCDGLDQMCDMTTTELPRCEVGDWLVFEDQGAYTHTASFIFNGYTHFPNKLHCYI